MDQPQTIGGRAIAIGRRIRHMGRLAQISNVFARHGFYSVLEAAGIKTWLTPEQAREAEQLAKNGSGLEPIGLPVRLRQCCEELGPAFVKLGQMLSSREDLLAPAYTDELRKLQTNVSQLPFSTIERILQEELGDERLKEFATINEQPIAAGSIGQVHEARLKTPDAPDGERVVIKVQRPGIAAQIEVDLGLMEVLAGLVERYVPEARLVRPRTLVEELRRATLGETDFVREAGNTTKMAANFKDVPHIVFPDVYWKYTTSRVLTLSYVDGISAWERDAIVSAGLDPKLLVNRGCQAFLQMAFVDGFFHGDLHAGNLLAMKESTIGFLDLGVTARLSHNSRERLAGLLMALVKEDYSAVVQHFAELSEPGPEFSFDAFEYDIANTVAPFMGLHLAQMRSGRLLWDLAKLAAKHGAPLPRDLVLFLKTLVTFEAIGSRLDPNFDVMKSCQEFAETLGAELYTTEQLKRQAIVLGRDLGYLARHAPFQMRRLLKSAADGELSLNIKGDDIHRIGVSLDRSSSRISVSMIVASLIVGSSIMVFSTGKSDSLFGVTGFVLAGLLGLYVVISIFRGGRI